MKAVSARKPYRENAGYVASRKCYVEGVGGHIVIYDRTKGFECDADDRWIVMHEPSSLHVSVATLDHARHLMSAIAVCSTRDEAREHADILPRDGEDF